MGFGARDFVHGANTANPQKLRLPMVNEVKIHFLKETKNTKKLEKSRY